MTTMRKPKPRPICLSDPRRPSFHYRDELDKQIAEVLGCAASEMRIDIEYTFSSIEVTIRIMPQFLEAAEENLSVFHRMFREIGTMKMMYLCFEERMGHERGMMGSMLPMGPIIVPNGHAFPGMMHSDHGNTPIVVGIDLLD